MPPADRIREQNEQDPGRVAHAIQAAGSNDFLAVGPVAVRGCLRPGQTSVLPPRQSDRQLIFLWLQRWHWRTWTVTNSTLSWGCNYVTQFPAESVLQCKHQFARSGQISEFHIFALQMPPLHSAARGACPLPSRRYCQAVNKSTTNLSN